MQFPAVMPIRPRGPIDAEVRPPGSKSITNRALLVAALAEGTSRVIGGLDSDDTVAMRSCLAELGVEVHRLEDGWLVEGGQLRAPTRTLDAGASGTTARFITAAAALVPGRVMVDGSDRMRQRPMNGLTEALAALGVRVEQLSTNPGLPLEVDGGGLAGGSVTVDGRRTSQFLSALLLVAPLAQGPLTIHLFGGELVSRPYVASTLEVMRAFGARVEEDSGPTYRVEPTGYEAREFTVEPDASAAAYPWAAAAVSGGRATVLGISPTSLQADLGLLDVLAEMGCEVERSPAGLTVVGRERLRGVDVDMNEFPDAVLAAAVVAVFAAGPSRIRNVANLRLKETDRLAALETELERLGAAATSGPDWLEVSPGPTRPALIRTYDDHRMAMAFAVAGLRIPGVVIDDPGCVSKTWPGFFDELERW